MIPTMVRDLSVTDLIRTADTLKSSGQNGSVVQLYAAWVQANATHPLLYAVLFNYSVVLTEVGALTGARDVLQQAVKLNPEFMPAYINLGRVYERLGQVGPALAEWSAALTRLAPLTGSALSYKTTALNQSARLLEALNQDEAAENFLRQSLELDPQQREVAQHYLALRQRQCEWPVVVPWERVPAETLLAGMSPLSAAAYTDDPLFQLALAWFYNKKDVGSPAGAYSDWPHALVNKGRLRIGYLCSDFREHALGHLLAEVPGLHDRHKVEVFVYYCGPKAQDPLHENFKAKAEHWMDISEWDDTAAARRMTTDGIQILVDLNGYTREARTKLLALRPAPVIVNWLGYPGTMASPYHHYLIADDWIIPPEAERYYTERVVRLPCYQPSNRQRVIASQTPNRRDAGLPEDAFVFCCFNGAHKITQFTFDRWLAILQRVPRSVLWLLGSNEATEKRLRQYAEARGITAERIIFAAKLTNPHHLARYPLADLFLDTTPYGAHTTSSDALWMGVPVLTVSGRSFASRVCGSLVRAAGLPELVCESVSEYVERAVALANDPAQLKALRQKLRVQRDQCVLFDVPGLVGRLEELYEAMWQDHQAGRLPRPDLTNLEVYLETGTRFNHEAVETQSRADYHDWWRGHLEQVHRQRPIPFDQRAFSAKP